MISQKMIELTPLQKLSKNLGKFLLPKALKSCPKSNKSPNLVTLVWIVKFWAEIFDDYAPNVLRVTLR